MPFQTLSNIFLLFLITSATVRGHGVSIERRQNSSSTACQTACETLLDNSGIDVHFPGNGNFTVWDAKQQEVVSACRVMPTSTDDVVRIMSALTENWCNFAVKGGGHARNADDSVSVGGVTVDMVRMKSMEVASNRTLAKIGSGHTLYSLYTGLEAYNLTTVGGRSGGVGIGGYALGGGFSNWSPKFGLGMDNIFEYSIVLPNATFVTVDQYNHPDLYYALRGGMSNFGIVTHYTMRAIPQGQLFGGSVLYTEDKLDAVANESYKLTTAWQNDTSFSFSYGYGYQQSTDTFDVALSEAYTQPNTDPAPFRGLNAIEHESSSLRVTSMSNLSVETADATPDGGRNLFATLTYYPSADLDKTVMQIMKEEIQPIKNVSGFFPNVISQPLTYGVVVAGKERGGNAVGIDDGPLTVILLTAVWDHAEDDDALYAFADRWIEKSKAASVAVGKDHQWLYINYAYTSQDPFAGYGEANQERLKTIQKAVDPQGVFASTGLARGYFKIN